MSRSGDRRVLGWVALATGLSASALGVVLAVQAVRPPTDVGAVPAAAAPASSPPPPTPADNAVIPVSNWAVPTRVTISGLQVDAPADPIGVRADRALAVPDDPQRLGWWIGSATPGSPRGTVLLAGHVDTADRGPGALFRLERLTMGSTIEVHTAEHTTTYRAVARRSFHKHALPADLFAPDTAPRLVLVTCGGTFHNGTYSHNVIVYAEPIDPAPPRPR